MQNVPSGPAANHPPTAVDALVAMLTRSNLAGLPHSVACSILWALARWADQDARTDAERPDLAADPDRRRAYRLGLAEHALATVHAELARLDAPSPPSPHPRPTPPGAPAAF